MMNDSRTFSMYDVIALTMLVLVVFSFVHLSGTAGSGFHFVDDHEIITLGKELQLKPLSGVISSWVENDIKANGRFRPLYIVIRVVETKILGADFYKWSLFNALIFSVALVFYYLASRRMGFNPVLSVLFILIIFAGSQTAILWRLGPGEGIAMAFTGLSMFFMLQGSSAGKNIMGDTLFVAGLFIASLVKESFIFAIPALIFLNISLEMQNRALTLREAFNRKIIPYSILLFIAMAAILYIFLNVGTGYATANRSVQEIFLGIFYSTVNLGKNSFYPSLLIIVLLLLNIYLNKGIRWRSYLHPFIFLVLLTAPLLVLYSSSGLEERYLFPYTVGLAYLVLSLFDGLRSAGVFFNRIIFVLAFLLLIPGMKKAVTDAKAFAADGVSTGLLLTEINSRNMPGTLVLLVADPVKSYELSVSLKTYLNLEYGISLYGYAMVPDNESSENMLYVEGWNSYFQERIYNKEAGKPSMLIFPDKDLANRFFSEPGFLQEEYSNADLKNAPFALYTRNK